MSESDPSSRGPSNWLVLLKQDVSSVAQLLEGPWPEGVREPLAIVCCYHLRLVDLLPESVAALGLLEVALLLRVAAGRALDAFGEGDLPAELELLRPLAADRAAIPELIGPDLLGPLEEQLPLLATVQAQGRSVADVVSDSAVGASIAADLRVWADDWAVPAVPAADRLGAQFRGFLATRWAERL